MKSLYSSPETTPSEIDQIKTIEAHTFCALPMMGCKVHAGFPSPAEDFMEGTLDLNEHLIKRPASTFHVRLTGLSMFNAGLHPGDILVVDKSEDAEDRDIVVAVVDGEFTVKRLYSRNGVIKLLAENPDFPDIEFKDGSELIIWGVVTSAIKPLKL